MVSQVSNQDLGHPRLASPLELTVLAVGCRTINDKPTLLDFANGFFKGLNCGCFRVESLGTLRF